ncbi:gamma-tubulin complex component 4-like [Agrilus planipennis]|nr:gamma-tubulin complex component 4-like [Agrilus planipennis]
MVYMIQSDSIRGCQIIGKLQRYLESGTESVNKAATRIIQFVNVIFFRQLCNWIIYGDLLDINDEFFICDGKDVDENFINEDPSHQEVTKFSDAAFDALKSSKLKRPPPIRRFFLREELFPFDNSKHLAEVILFIGQIVWIISNGPKEKTKDKLNLRYTRDVWEGKDVVYYQKLQKLEKSAINITEFEATIEECRLTLAKYLWNIMVEEANLLEHLQLVRDYFCLGRGELFQQFIVSAENSLKDNPCTST